MVLIHWGFSSWSIQTWTAALTEPTLQYNSMLSCDNHANVFNFSLPQNDTYVWWSIIYCNSKTVVAIDALGRRDQRSSLDQTLFIRSNAVFIALCHFALQLRAYLPETLSLALDFGSTEASVMACSWASLELNATDSRKAYYLYWTLDAAMSIIQGCSSSSSSWCKYSCCQNPLQVPSTADQLQVTCKRRKQRCRVLASIAQTGPDGVASPINMTEAPRLCHPSEKTSHEWRQRQMSKHPAFLHCQQVFFI